MHLQSDGGPPNFPPFFGNGSDGMVYNYTFEFETEAELEQYIGRSDYGQNL